MKTLILLMMAAVSVSSVEFHDCGSNATEIYASISCLDENEQACSVLIDDHVTMNVVFAPRQKITSAEMRWSAKLYKAWIQHHYSEEDACEHWGLRCPVAIGEQTKMQFTVSIPEHIPERNFSVRCELVTEEGLVICLEFDVRTKSKRSHSM